MSRTWMLISSHRKSTHIETGSRKTCLRLFIHSRKLLFFAGESTFSAWGSRKQPLAGQVVGPWPRPSTKVWYFFMFSDKKNTGKSDSMILATDLGNFEAGLRPCPCYPISIKDSWRHSGKSSTNCFLESFCWLCFLRNVDQPSTRFIFRKAFGGNLPTFFRRSSARLSGRPCQF